MACRQLKALIWKNFRQRSIVGLVCDLVLPIVLGIILFKWAQDAKPYTVNPIPTYPVYNYTTPSSNLSKSCVGYYPQSVAGEKLEVSISQISGASIDNIIGYESVPEGFESHNKKYCTPRTAFLNYVDLDRESVEVPQNLRVMIVYDYNDDDPYDFKSAPHSPILTSQKLVADAFLNYWRQHKNVTAGLIVFRTQEIPTPGKVLTPVGPEVYLVWLMGFVFLTIIMRTTRRLVFEREYKLKASIKLMGVSNNIYWLSWFLSEIFWFILIAVIFATFISVGNPKVLKTTDRSLVFIFLIMWAIDAMSYSFLLSCFVKKDYNAVVLTVLVSLALFLGIPKLEKHVESVFLKCILGTFVFNYALDATQAAIVRRENAGFPLKGYTWSALLQLPPNDSTLALSSLFNLIFLNIIWNFLAVWYVDNISRGEYGLPQPWNFYFKKTYWCPRQEESDFEDDELPPRDERYFEHEMSDFRAGIQLRNLVKEFNGKVAVAGVNLNIYQEHTTVLLGHDGAGKTTTMAMITGIIPPTKGTAIVDGFDVTRDLKEARKILGLCPQYDNLFAGLTCQDHLWFYSALKGVETTQEDGLELLEDVGLLEKQKTAAKKLSGGERRKLSVVCAFIGNPKVVVLDEPTSGLDPGSRQDLWTFLKKIRENRALLVTTHYMEEANCLGDRIAIIAEGVVKCCGTPMFLKDVYGVGYTLLIAMKPYCWVENLTMVIQDIIPSAELLSHTKTEAYFSLPDVQLRMFPKLFHTLEQKAGVLKIKSFGLDGATMDEVYVKVGRGFVPQYERQKIQRKERVEEAHAIFDEEPVFTSVDPGSHVGTEELDEDIWNLETYDCNTGMTRSLQQMRGILTKKAILTKRHWILTLLLSILCPVFLLIGLHVDFGSALTISAPMWYSLSDFALTTTVSVLIFPSIHPAPFRIYKDQIKGPHLVEVRQLVTANETDNEAVNKYYLESAVAKDFLQYKLKHILGVVFNPEGQDAQLVTLYSTGTKHSIAISIQFLLNTYVRARLGSNYSIETGLQQMKTLAEYRLSKIPKFTILTMDAALAILPALFVHLLIYEREVGARHLQEVSGISPIIYWFSTFVWDFLIVYVVMVAFLLTFLYRPAIYFSEGRWTLTFLILMVFSLAMLPNVYFLQLLFKKPGSGVALIILFSVLTGVVGAVFILNVKASQTKDPTLKAIAEFLDIKFRILCPIYNLALCIFCLAITTVILESRDPLQPWRFREYFEDRSVMTVNLNMTGPFVTLIVQCVLYSILVFLHDYRFVWRLGYMNKPDRDPPDGAPIEDGDDFDVQAERTRINHTELPHLFKTDALVLKNLQKKYGHFTAVYGTSVGMSQNECFGLLGQNGAGKSTTFKMLTGDIRITDGHCYLFGHSVRHKLKTAQSYMGYCPQDDGLHDNLTGRETLYLYGRLRGVPEKVLRPVSDQLFQILAMSEYADELTKTYSGGTKRKLSTGIALIGNPRFILLDEPTRGLDFAAKRTLWTVFKRVRAAGRMLMMASHSMEECNALCTRIAIQVGGKVKCLGTPQYLKSKFGQGYSIIVHVGPKDEPEAPQASPGDASYGSDDSDEEEKEAKYSHEEEDYDLGDDLKLPEAGSVTLNEFITTALPGATVMDEKPGHRFFRLPEAELKLSRIFRVMEMTRAHYGVLNYSIQQTTLEQVFLAFIENDPETQQNSTLLAKIKGICH